MNAKDMNYQFFSKLADSIDLDGEHIEIEYTENTETDNGQTEISIPILNDFFDGQHVLITTPEVFDAITLQLKSGHRFVSQEYSEASFANVVLMGNTPLLFDRNIEIEAADKHTLFVFNKIGHQEWKSENPFDISDDGFLLIRMKNRTDIFKCVFVVKNICL